MLADYHTHTVYSDDSVYPMEDVIKDAIRLGLSELCFTDHVDYGIKPDWDSVDEVPMRDGQPLANVDYPRFVAEFNTLKEKYQGQIALKMGMEFGMQMHTIPQYEALFARYPFDFIILSVHEVEDKEFWNMEFQAGRTQSEYNDRYYAELLNLVRAYKHYSVLGHLDLIARYDPAGLYPFEKIRPIVTEILKQVIADGKGIEVNTSSHRYGLEDLTPSRDILRLYRDLGGKIITLGSDSHEPQHLGAYLADTQRWLRELGFTEFCTFDKMQPTYHPLEG